MIMAANNINKRANFEKVAGKRITYIIDKIKLLGNCANRNNYEYHEDDISKMFSAIRSQLKETEKRYRDELEKKAKKSFKF